MIKIWSVRIEFNWLTDWVIKQSSRSFRKKKSSNFLNYLQWCHECHVSNYKDLTKEFSDVFVWTYINMPGLDTSIVVHFLLLIERCQPVKHKLRRMRPNILIKVKEEVRKQWDAGFLKMFKYPQRVSNIVVLPKKDNKFRVFMDFKDLNRASLKNDFPLPHVDLLVDNAANKPTCYFMDRFFGYNQIKMAEEDKEKTTFVTPCGTFCYMAIWFQKCWSHISVSDGNTLLLYDA